MRGSKKPETPALKGHQIYRNYLRPHEGLNGKTPAGVCGIEIKGDNKWITVIQNARNMHNHNIERDKQWVIQNLQ